MGTHKKLNGDISDNFFEIATKISCHAVTLKREKSFSYSCTCEGVITDHYRLSQGHVNNLKTTLKDQSNAYLGPESTLNCVTP